MCCLFSALVLIGPRAAILVWWLMDQVRWEEAFNSFFWALAGFLVAPWTTIVYVLVFPGGVTGFDWVWMILAILTDIASWSGGAVSGRRRYSAQPA